LLAECGTLKFNGEPPELHDFGRTLMAGVCNAYSPHFVLSGLFFLFKFKFFFELIFR